MIKCWLCESKDHCFFLCFSLPIFMSLFSWGLVWAVCASFGYSFFDNLSCVCLWVSLALLPVQGYNWVKIPDFSFGGGICVCCLLLVLACYHTYRLRYLFHSTLLFNPLQVRFLVCWTFCDKMLNFSTATVSAVCVGGACMCVCARASVCVRVWSPKNIRTRETNAPKSRLDKDAQTVRHVGL